MVIFWPFFLFFCPRMFLRDGLVDLLIFGIKVTSGAVHMHVFSNLKMVVFCPFFQFFVRDRTFQRNGLVDLLDIWYQSHFWCSAYARFFKCKKVKNCHFWGHFTSFLSMTPRFSGMARWIFLIFGIKVTSGAVHMHVF